MSSNRAETECSACGWFIGSWEICPFCRHFNPKRPLVRWLKYTSPFLTILGIVLLGYMGRIYGRPSATVAELGRKVNFAQVTIKGQVSEPVRFYRGEDGGGDSLEFEVDDGTGVIRIRCYDDAYQALKDAGKIPGKGDLVTLMGNYQYKAKRQFIILSSDLDLEIAREPVETATPIAHVLRANESGIKEGQRLMVTGKITRKIAGNYDFTILLGNPDGQTLAVVLPKNMMEAYGLDGKDNAFWASWNEGDYMTAVGYLKWYRGRNYQNWQIIPSSPSDLTASDEATWEKHNGGK